MVEVIVRDWAEGRVYRISGDRVLVAVTTEKVDGSMEVDTCLAGGPNGEKEDLGEILGILQAIRRDEIETGKESLN